MKRWQGVVEVTNITRYNCQVIAESEAEARRKLESSSMDELESTYPCECECNAVEGTRKAHGVRRVIEKH